MKKFVTAAKKDLKTDLLKGLDPRASVMQNFKEYDCTYHEFGNLEIEQPQYYCSKCKIDLICINCIRKCHGKCTDENLDIDKFKNREKSTKFNCACGKFKFHQPEKNNTSSCSFHLFDEQKGIPKLNNIVCSMCFFLCKDTYSETLNNNDNENIDMNNFNTFSGGCQCKAYRHKESNLFFIKIISDLKEFKNLSDEFSIKTKKRFEWPLQLINYVSSTDALEEIKKIFVGKLKNATFERKGSELEDNTKIIQKNVINLMNENTKILLFPYFYHSNLLEIFSYENLVKLIKFTQINSQSIIFNLQIFSILYYLQIKNDFYSIKQLSISDFLTESLLERLTYRNNLSNLLNVKSFNKYFVTNKDTTLKKLIINSEKLFPENLNFSNKDDKILSSLISYLKLVLFSLKLMTFDTDELHLIINSLFSFQNFLNKNFELDVLSNNFLIIHKLLAKVFLVIGVTYNDSILKNQLHKEKDNPLHNEKEVKPEKENYSQKGKYNALLENQMLKETENQMLKETEMQIKETENQSQIETEFQFKNDEKNQSQKEKKNQFKKDENFIHIRNDYTEKLLKMVLTNFKILKELSPDMKTLEVISNENLKLLTLSNNFYKKQLDNMNLDDYKKNLELKIINYEFPNLKEEIKNKLSDYFNFETKDKPNDAIVKLIKDNINEYLKKSANNNYNKEGMKLEEITEKLKKYLKKDFNLDNFSKVESVDALVSNLIKSSIDEIITSSFNYFKETKEKKIPFYQETEIDYLLNFLSLFFLTKKGLKYFCLGNNLSRIFKLFDSFPNKIINFMYLFFKSAKVYEVDLKNHKVINLFTNKITLYFNDFNFKTAFDDNDTSAMILISSMKIINKISMFIEFEEYETIKNYFCSIITKNQKYGFLSLDEFNSIFEAEEFIQKNAKKNENVEKNYYVNNNVKLLEEKIELPSMHIVESHILTFYEEENSNNNSLEIINKNKTNVSIIENNKVLQRKNKENKTTSSLTQYTLMCKFYFSFFQLISKNTFYMYYNNNENLHQQILNFIEPPIKKYINAASSFLTIRKRKILLRTIRSYIIIDRIDQIYFTNNYQYLSSEDYQYYYKSKNKNFIKLNDILKLKGKGAKEKTEEEFKVTKTKYAVVEKIIEYVEVFKNELNIIDELSKNEKQSVQKTKQYIRELIYSLKTLADFSILESSLWERVAINLFNLTNEFISKIPNLIKYYDNTKVLKDIKIIELEHVNDPQLIFGKNNLYKIFVERFDFLLSHIPDWKKENNLERFFYNYDKINDIDFYNESLVETKRFKYFYNEIKDKYKAINQEKEKVPETNDVSQKNKLEDKKEIPNKDKIVDKNDIPNKVKIIEKYESDFKKFKNLSFLFFKQPTDQFIMFSNIILDYFITYFSNPNHLKFGNNYYLLTVVNKLLFYQTETTQKLFTDSKLIDNSLFWKNYFEAYQATLQKVICLSKNYPTLCNEEYFQLTLTCKEFIQFLQLLSEQSNESFHSLIFQNKDNLLPNSIYNTLGQHYSLILKKILNLNIEVNFNLPYDTLVFLLHSYTDFFIEYIQTSKDKTNLKFLAKSIEEMELFELISDSQQISLNNDLYIRNDISGFSYITLIDILIEITEKIKIEAFVLPPQFNKIILLKIIICRFKILTVNMKKNGKLKNEDIDTYTQLYKEDSEFRENLDFKLCLKIYNFIKNFYDDFNVDSLLDSLYESLKFKNEEEENGEEEEYQEKKVEEEENKEKEKSEKKFYKELFHFLESIVLVIEITMENSNHKYFFIRPWISFYLREKTKKSFFENVNRETTASKLNSLVDSSDYFMFEMLKVYNSSNDNIYNKYLLNLNYFHAELLNFIFIVIHQILLIIYFYKDATTPISGDSSNNNFIVNNFILAILQLVFLLTIIIIWFILEFPLHYQKNLSIDTDRKIIFKNSNSKIDISFDYLKSLYQNNNEDKSKFKNPFDSKEISKWSKIKAALNSIFLNSEINILIFSFILVFLYLVIGSPFILIISIWVIVNLFSTLLDIVVAVQLRWKQLLTLLSFTYLNIYIFAWIGLLWIKSLFIFDDAQDPTENYCSSSVQCILFMIDYGIRSGGGIGDQLQKISYKENPSFFVGKFFYDIVFHIVIILILGNIFLGIIVDTFAELRDKTQFKEQDKNTKCYICQMKKENSYKENLNFKDHIKYIHYMWNYVYFLTDLHIINENLFDKQQRHVCEMLIKNDISWIPIIKEDGEGITAEDKKVEKPNENLIMNQDEKLIEGLIEKFAKKYDENLIEKTIEKFVKRNEENLNENPKEKLIENSVKLSKNSEEQYDENSDENYEGEFIENSYENSGENVFENSGENAIENLGENLNENSEKKSFDLLGENSYKKSFDHLGEDSDKKSIDHSIEKSFEHSDANYIEYSGLEEIVNSEDKFKI